MKKIFFLVAGIAFSFQSYYAQYNSCAAKSVVTESKRVKVLDEVTGDYSYEQQEVPVQQRDNFGNASGNQYDLAVDGAFEGQTIVVLHLYTGENFDFEAPKKALAEKGFSVYRYINNPPSPEELKKSLDKACQLWVISTTTQRLNDEHAKVIKEFFDSGRGVYIWGDNDPYHADADFLSKKLLGTTMSGYYTGSKNVTFKDFDTKGGMVKNHLITTGLEYVFEGITISQLHDPNQQLTPLIWSSDGNVVTGIYERDGKRLIIDGGFTRLYCNWNTAGTGRYVKNAAAWLVNYERFGDEVLGENIK
ncbi:MAG: hypothetical protein EP338_06990 [Bacteroidetes bacterium]|nr:MAG: hypothetical protein EP338_06990 [Bacteroidota bacterium]